MAKKKEPIVVRNAQGLVEEFQETTEKNTKKEKRRRVLLIILSIIAVTAVVLYIILPHWYTIYRDIKATPFSRPKVTRDKPDDTDSYSKEEIEAAYKTVENYCKDWEKKNGRLYLLDVGYSDVINTYEADVEGQTPDGFICITGTVYNGKGSGLKMPSYTNRMIRFEVTRESKNADWDKVTPKASPEQLVLIKPKVKDTNSTVSSDSKETSQTDTTD